MSRAPRRLHLAGLAGVVVLAVVYAAYYGLRTHAYQPDEFNAVVGGRLFLDAPFHALFDTTIFTRGPERLSAIVLAFPFSVISSTADQLRAAHVLLSLCSCLAAVPAYLWARGLGLRPWQALAAGAVTVITPWLLYATTFLNVTLGLPLTTLFLFVTWRAVVRPSHRGDVLVLVVAGLNTMARVGHITFVVVAAVAVFVQTWRERPVRESVWDSLRLLPVRIWRRHPVLVAAGAVVLAVVLWLGPYRIVGKAYSTNVPRDITAQQLWDKARLIVAELGMGTGYLPFMLGAPWAVREAFRPRRPESGAFGVIAVAMLVVFVLTDVTAVPDERYVAVLAVLPAVAFAAACFRREASALGALLAGLVLARCVVTQGLYPDQGSYSYFVAPARFFFTRVIEGRASVTLPSVGHIATIALLVATAVAVLLAALRSRWNPRLAGRTVSGVALGVALAGVIAVGAASAQWNTHRFTDLNSSPGLSFEQLTVVDRATGNQPVALWNQGQSVDPGREYEIALEQFFNRSLKMMLVMPGEATGWRIGIGGDGGTPDLRHVLLDPRSGRMRLDSGAFPRYLASFEGFRAFGFAARTILRTTQFGPDGLRLDRLIGPPRVLWSVRGTASDGWLPRGRSRAVITTYGAPGRACLRVTLQSPPGPAARFPYVLRSGRFRNAGRMRPQQDRTVTIPLDGRTAILENRAVGELPGARPVGIGMTEDIAVLPCRR